VLARGGGGGEQLLQLQCHIPLDFPVIVVVRLQSHFYESSSFDDCKNSTHIVLGSPSLSRHICPSLSQLAAVDIESPKCGSKWVAQRAMAG